MIAAIVEDLDLLPADAAHEVSATIHHLDAHLANEVIGHTRARAPIAPAGKEAWMMLPANTTVYAIVEIARAALSGNPVRARMTRRARLVSALIQRIFNEVLPERVHMERSLSGPDFVTRALDSDDVPFFMAWGGEALGDELLARLPRGKQKRIVFEGPGKDPAIILPGAHPREVAAALISAKFAYSGQTCTAPENLLIHRSVHDEIVELLVSAAGQRRVGDPREQDVDVGPMMSPKIPPLVKTQLSDAVAKGAEILLGGRVEGAYVYPTVVTGVTPAMRIFRDETFAPVFAICVFDSEEEAIALARDSRFGLRVSAGGVGARRVIDQLLGTDYAEPVAEITYGKFGIGSVDSFADSVGSPAFGGYGKSGWIWDRDQLYQGPKATAREATIPLRL
ncbi:hypothetical protein ROR02_07480 [Pararhodospirillum oryzae]|uniref:Aldehyde dehydrogenase domain-containing protein n=2 Tax=Pararhodospirillum oryzae TaxID=478448 RepID=A0A512H5B0_9PROT|nr:hypothetical protein ROR02_07480 [Pararhodospirillum oryzae]